MQAWTDVSQVPVGFGPSAVTLGNFDGVHRGHRVALQQLAEQGRRRGAVTAAVTFTPHPLQVLHPDRAPQMITGLDHRLELLAETGLDAVLVMEFTRELAEWSPERFVREIFIEALRACVVVVGRDVRFGRRNVGDLHTLCSLGQRHGFEVISVGPAGDERRWSSTWVRDLLGAGEVAAAALVLGRAHRVDGVVVHGDHRGREMGYPTANLDQRPAGMVPADGVYAGWLRVLAGPPGSARPTVVPGSGERLPAAISVGTNPTFDGHERRVEAYVLDRTDLELYGCRVGFEFVRRLRETLRFEGVGALVEQMAIDVERCRTSLLVS